MSSIQEFFRLYRTAAEIISNGCDEHQGTGERLLQGQEMRAVTCRHDCLVRRMIPICGCITKINPSPFPLLRPVDQKSDPEQMRINRSIRRVSGNEADAEAIALAHGQSGRCDQQANLDWGLDGCVSFRFVVSVQFVPLLARSAIFTWFQHPLW